ncbi:UDP-N-acetylmuramoyl-L-alanyl-D-glutamate--2, 6-diaminopimelate ligase [Filibacter tadaridae]|uniref:UDP-N-acetylmuramoyl-L-alanyl-D-glutamate--2,6-diaminopimelate ligase n=1 Tax=Filibacter tadaridae TaxID=2483811 RepID=A0A3P5X6D1_9BACL|nr:UDP-N-acetylmuramoyl-L-alanyl-D-glutamate--2,6-diaminopimelate ligase [Filibacter tadaridae]VDC29869.1 UDP-N-acetylmuramoyl-L-alanyl-D-glutamate--2, 6-diaminopimelate ligase [Filibacter tadaridae]
MVLLLPELLKDWPCTVHGGDFRIDITGITEQSVRVKKGFIFVARKGTRYDGIAHIDEAIQKGAVAIIVDRFTLTNLPKNIPVIIVPDCKKFLSYASARLAGDPSKELTIIGVTGTNGKTTVTHFIGQLLSGVGVKSAVVGTTGVFIDGEEMDVDVPSMTTFPAEYLHPLLKRCVEESVTHVVLEASSLGLSSCRLDHCEMDIGLLLNIGTDHHEEHGGETAYLMAKQRLLSMVNVMVVNEEDENCISLIKGATVPSVFFGLQTAAGIPFPQCEFQLPVQGDFNRLNVMAAISALLVLGYSTDELFPHITDLKLPEGRMQKLERDGVMVFIDFAHTPDALQGVLQALSEMCYGRLITVFGCGGERDRRKRSEMGELAVYYSSNVLVTSDNPRNEDPQSIIEDIMEGFGGECSAVEAELDRRTAIRKAVFSAAPGDIVLIAGKGHEKTQHTAKGLFPFSDLLEAEKALLEKTYLYSEEIQGQ